jgi:signal transduction histidine kinase
MRGAAPWLGAWPAVLGAVLAFVAFDASMRTLDIEVPPPGTLRIVEALRLGETSPEPPSAQATGWVRRALPDAFVQPGQRINTAWYRMQVELDPDRHPLWAVYLRRPLASFVVRVNGHTVGDTGTSQEPLPLYLADLMFTVPPALLKPGRNEISVRTARIPNYGYLGEVWIGDHAALATMGSRLHLVGRELARVVVAIVAVLALLHGAFYALRPRERAYGWFAAALALWAFHCAWPLFDLAPIRIEAWRPLSQISLGWFTILATGFVHRFLDLRRPWVERALIGYGTAGAALLWVDAFAPQPMLDAFEDYVWVPSYLVIGAYQVSCFAVATRRRDDWEMRLIGAFALFLLLVGARDYLLDLGLLDLGPLGSGSSAGRYFRYAGSLVLVVFGIVLMRRFVAALDESETLNRDLEARVAGNSAVIAANYRRIADLDRQKARIEERERLLRDMHDGIGGQLVQALAMSERGVEPARMREVIQACLDDLRLVIDTGSAGDEGLAPILAALRDRLRRRLDGSGLAIDWPPGALDRLPPLSPHRALQVVRVLQEAVSNVLKHAQARRVGVRCDVGEDGSLQLDVRDDGRGIDPAAAAGRGLGNMRARAAELGATLDIVTGSDGTEVRLRIPPLP